MKNTFILLYALCLLVSYIPVQANEIFIEAESFEDKGGWVVDQQFMDVMGSPYLLAHGSGKAVADANTRLEITEDGTYYIYVRTYNWTAPFSQEEGCGKFALTIGQQFISGILGTQGKEWQWQLAGKANLKKGTVLLTLHDLTGLEGRCDAIYLSTEPMKNLLSDGSALRQRLIPDYNKIEDKGNFDFVVVGGGYSGICAAVSAARLGLKVALVTDRPILGGNNSSEVRVQLGGAIECEPYPNLGNLIKEFAPTKKGNAAPAAIYHDEKKMNIVTAEKNITLFTNIHINKVKKQGQKITAVVGRHIETGKAFSFQAPLFADCTGDGTVGYLAGAEYRIGREAKSMYNEPDGVAVADKQILGTSIQWNSKPEDKEQKFPDLNYGFNFNDDNVQYIKKGTWTWETGMRKDPIKQAEQVRDYGLLAIYANWAYLKNHSIYKEEFKNLSLDWMAFVAGKRESRRIIGDYVLTQKDIEQENIQKDATCTTSWSIDLHFPDPENTKYFPGKEFKSICTQEEIPLYPIPYRCFYSKDISNLFMAGRDISVSHIALGSVRVMRTCAMMGEVVGLAAVVCSKHKAQPRAVYKTYFKELQALMKEGAGKKDLPNNQLTNVGRNSHHYFIKAEEKNK